LTLLVDKIHQFQGKIFYSSLLARTFLDKFLPRALHSLRFKHKNILEPKTQFLVWIWLEEPQLLKLKHPLFLQN
jgi:hypothetical protein